MGEFDTASPHIKPPPLAAWLMCNPSKADGEVDDQTALRVVHFSRALGCGAAIVVNVLPWRATDPNDMLLALRTGRVTNEMMLENLKAIGHSSLRAQRHIVAFGVLPRELGWHRARALERFSNHADQLLCLGISPGGWPLHPLARGRFAIPNSTVPKPWEAPTNT
jgi:hypothetical protein